MNNDFKRITEEITNNILGTNNEKNFRRRSKHFIADFFSNNTTQIDWPQFCDVVKKHSAGKFAMPFLVSALKQGLSFGEYTLHLQKNKALYEEMLKSNYTNYQNIFCGCDLPKQIILRSTKKDWKFSYFYVNTNNHFLIQIMSEFLETGMEYRGHITSEMVYHFASSFGDKEKHITSLQDFRCQMLFKQTEFYRCLFANNTQLFSATVSTLCSFYRWLVNEYADCDFFHGSLKITRKMLFSTSLSLYLKEQYFFTRFSLTNIPFGESKIVFLTTGLDNLSTRFLSEDYFTLNLSKLKNTKYRDLLIEFLLTTSHSLGKGINCGILARMLQCLHEAKQSGDYPNPNPLHLTTAEAIFIKKFYFDSPHKKLQTKNNQVGAARSFFKWCQNAGKMTFDDLFFDHFALSGFNKNSNPISIPDDELITLNEHLLKKSHESLRHKLTYAIFHLALQTPFRVSQICHLRIDSIRPTLKPDQYRLISNTKTSDGEKIETPLTNMTFRLLKNIIEETNELREKNCPEELKNYIFLYQQENPKTTAVMNATTFGYELKLATEATGIRRYSFSNLRQTYMSKSVEYIIRNGKSNMELSLLTKHKQIDTTLKHYVDLELERMLEATYGVEIGKVHIDKEPNIVDKFSPDLSNENCVVEYGCGKCSAKGCESVTMLSCLTCENFVTTPQHAPYFEREITKLQHRIYNTDNKHEKEDLTIIKTLYVRYLQNIYLYQEKQNG